MTRKEAVLRYLRARPNQWVPGMELMNADVGGTRAGARIFDLREDGHEIENRPSKRSAVYEYRLVVPDVAPGQVDLGLVA
jgi:hypothetical protein